MERNDYLYRGAVAGEAQTFILGVPARHLTSDDVKALDDDARADLVAHVRADGGTYEDNRLSAKEKRDRAAARKKRGSKLGEAADPTTAGQTDADQTAPGVSPDPTPPTPTSTPSADDDIVTPLGEPLAPGQVSSDRVVTG